MPSAPIGAAAGTGMPAAEIVVDAALVRRLLEAQHPDLAALPLTVFAEGWDNTSFRLGADLLARMPRRALGARLLLNEQRWLPVFAPRLPAPVPAPVRIGAPGAGYPWPWSIAPFLRGEPLDVEPLAAGGGEAIGGFLNALHQPPATDAPINPFRGGPLAERVEGFAPRATRLSQLGQLPPAIEGLWAKGLAAPMDAAPVWLHGDPHPLNVLAENGRLSAVIDWGDLCAGDPASDLGGLWALLPDPAERAAALQAYGRVSEATLARARAWACNFGVLILDAGLVNSPRHARIGQAILANLAADD